MKIGSINSTRTTGFQGKSNFLSASYSHEGDLTNAGAYGLTCMITAIPGIDFAKKGFKNASAIGKAGKIAGGVGIMLGLAVPIFAILKLLNIVCRPSYTKKYDTIDTSHTALK